MYFSALAINGTQMAVAPLDVTQIGHWEHFLGSVCIFNGMLPKFVIVLAIWSHRNQFLTACGLMF